jgi:hypothetical protein
MAGKSAFEGRKIVVLRNSPHDKCVAEGFKDSEVLPMARENNDHRELAADRGDIDFGSAAVSDQALPKSAEGKHFRQVGAPVRPDGGSGVGIAVSTGDDAVREPVNAALEVSRTGAMVPRLLRHRAVRARARAFRRAAAARDLVLRVAGGCAQHHGQHTTEIVARAA